jgi:hypothetical protein
METETALEIVISLFIAVINYYKLVKSSSLYKKMQQDLFIKCSIVIIIFKWIDVYKLL